MKVFQLAKELGIDSRLVLKRCQQHDMTALVSHMSEIPPKALPTIRSWFLPPPPPTRPPDNLPPNAPAPSHPRTPRTPLSTHATAPSHDA